MGNTSIQWTNKSWSPLRARVLDDAAAVAERKGYTSLVQIAGKMAGHVGQHCEHLSDGCLHCYSETDQHRCLPNNGTGLPFDRRSRDLIEPFVDKKILMQPLHWKKPQRIFVENQSDLFGEWNTDEMIDQVLAIGALCPEHTLQILTKRAKRMLEYFGIWPERQERIDNEMNRCMRDIPKGRSFPRVSGGWPLPNVWLGVSVEDQKTADERIPLLLQTPAAVRFVSYEPALGPVDFSAWLPQFKSGFSASLNEAPWIDWVIVGGESGPGARPFDIAWARQTIAQCKAAGVKCFVKQLGANPIMDRDDPLAPGVFIPPYEFLFKDRKGGKMEEWPEHVRVREFPA